MGWSSCDCFRTESGRLSRKIHRNENVFESKCIENSRQCRSSSSLILHKSLILSKYRESCTFAMHEAVSFKRHPKPMFQHFPLNVATCVVYIHFRCVESISHGVFHVRTSWHRMVCTTCVAKSGCLSRFQRETRTFVKIFMLIFFNRIINLNRFFVQPHTRSTWET